jgi:glycosyltransferase involved in cell wall biosynthesis
LTNSFFSRESILRAYGLNSFVCYLGVDTTVFKRKTRAKEDYVLSVGSCTPTKGFDFLIRALSRLEGRLRPRLVIVSNTVNARWRLWLERLAAQEDVTLEFKTLLPDEDLVELYNRAIGFLYAPYLEPFGLAPVEAMACGTAVVAVKEGGVRESVIHEQTGVLVERDEDAFADAVQGLLLDRARRHRVEREGMEWVQAFWTLQHAGQRLLRNLDRVMNGGHAVTTGASRSVRSS